MIGYALLVLIAFATVVLGSVVVGVAIWGWNQEKKKMQASDIVSQNPSLSNEI